MPNDQEIMIYSDIEPFEYKPRLYYERMCQNGAVGNDELFFRVWRATGSACNFSMPAMLTVHSNPIFIAITLTRIFNKGNVDYDTLADSIKYMFAGVAIGILSIKDIVELYLHY